MNKDREQLKQNFISVISEAGVPVAEAEYRDYLQKIADDASLPIANPSKYSAFWVFVKEAVSKPLSYIIDLLAEVFLPNMYVKTAEGLYLNILAYAYDVERKEASGMEGMVKFSRSNLMSDLVIPAGSSVRTIPLNGTVYRIFTIAEAVIAKGNASVNVRCRAEKPGSNYNLSANYYNILDCDIPGVTEAQTPDGYMLLPGADAESDDSLRYRIRYQFSAVGDWHTDAKYRTMISRRIGFSPDRIYFQKYEPEKYPCRGPGSADAFVLFDSGEDPTEALSNINQYISDEGNHGHGDGLSVFAMPELKIDLIATLVFYGNIPEEKRQLCAVEAGNIIRAAFWGNNDYPMVEKSRPFSRFAWSMLAKSIHEELPEVESVLFNYAEDIISNLTVPRIGTLEVKIQ